MRKLHHLGVLPLFQGKGFEIPKIYRVATMFKTVESDKNIVNTGNKHRLLKLYEKVKTDWANKDRLLKLYLKRLNHMLSATHWVCKLRSPKIQWQKVFKIECFVSLSKFESNKE